MTVWAPWCDLASAKVSPYGSQCACWATDYYNYCTCSARCGLGRMAIILGFTVHDIAWHAVIVIMVRNCSMSCTSLQHNLKIMLELLEQHAYTDYPIIRINLTAGF